jgi:plastocyanin
MNTISKLTLTTILMALAACGGSTGDGYGNAPPPPPPPPGDGKTVNATPSETFTPATLTVNAGDAVTFAFGGLAHNVFFDAAQGAPANIPGAIANSSIQRTFATAGTYGYGCTIHPSMRGTVVVQ